MNKQFASACVLVGAIIITGTRFAQLSESANLTDASITLANSRLSFKARLAAGNTTNTSVTIKSTGNSTYTSVDTGQLIESDVLTIGTGTYTMRDRSTSTIFSITTPLVSGDIDEDDPALMSVSDVITAEFTTVSAVVTGDYRVLVPAAASNSNDGIPDAGFFDRGSVVAGDITCNTTGGQTFNTPTVTTSTFGGLDYHIVTCPVASGTNTVGDVITITIGSTNTMINPAPASASRTLGVADTYEFLVQHRNGSAVVVDQTTVVVGAVEAVQVTAEVAPQLTFTIAGVASSTSVCGTTTSVTTSAVAVPLGQLSISAFTNAAQNLEVSTNAVNGYAVTAIANDQLGLNGATCTGDPTLPTSNCIIDSRGDNASMSHTTSDNFNNTATKGFAYSLHDTTADVGNMAFNHNDSGTFYARQFADAESSQAPQVIFSSNTVADGEDAYVCYRAIVPAAQPAGLYYNYITYTATATF